MSFFPTPDLDKMHASSLMLTQSRPLIQTPPQSAQPGKLVDNFIDTMDTRGHLGSDVHTSAGTFSEGCGLGLMSFSTHPSDMPYHVSVPLDQMMPVSFSWSSALYTTSQSQSSAYQQSRRDSATWSESCDPTSTILPSVVWHGLSNNTPVANSCEVPTGLSPYSAHSSSSATSTPYSRCEDYSSLRSAHSSMVKIEGIPEATTALHHIEEPYPLEQSLLVRPRDVQPHYFPDAEAAQMYVKDDASALTDTDVEARSGSLRSKSEYQPSHSSALPQERKASPAVSVKMKKIDASTPDASTRSKRTYTKEDNACCSCEQCGKLFQRSYNLRAHMETHDPERRHPHVCPWPQCTKRFVRRTDLTRHEQSVHFKTRHHICPFCNATFARKDTLTRHVDDGCSHRIEYKMKPPRSRRMSKSARRRSVTAPSPLRYAEQYV